MTEEDKVLIAEASKWLRLRDIVLYESRMRRPFNFPEDREVEELKFQFKRIIQYYTEATDNDSNALIVKIDLGVRIVDASQSSDEEEPLVFAEIEADYLVQYDMASDLREECIKAFTEFNCVHNVWPFWRQHVFDIVQRGRLPAIDIPLFNGAIFGTGTT